MQKISERNKNIYCAGGGGEISKMQIGIIFGGALKEFTTSRYSGRSKIHSGKMFFARKAILNSYFLMRARVPELARV